MRNNPKENLVLQRKHPVRGERLHQLDVLPFGLQSFWVKGLKSPLHVPNCYGKQMSWRDSPLFISQRVSRRLWDRRRGPFFSFFFLSVLLSPSLGSPAFLISPKCRVLCVLFSGKLAGSRGASETWENEMRWLFILPPAQATYLFFFFFPLSPSGSGARPKTTPEAMYTNHTSRTELDGRTVPEECSSH